MKISRKWLISTFIHHVSFQKFEKVYMKELTEKKFVSAKTQFEYAWCLVRSKYGADINNGIKIFETLCKDDPDNKRDYIYYLAVAYIRIKDFQTAQNYVKAFLEIEPNNMQVMLLDVSSNWPWVFNLWLIPSWRICVIH